MKRFFNLFLCVCFFYHSSFGFHPSREINSVKGEKANINLLSDAERIQIEKENEERRKFRERLDKIMKEQEKRMQKQKNINTVTSIGRKGFHLIAFILVLTIVGSALYQVEASRRAGMPFSMKWLKDTVASTTEEVLNDGHIWGGLVGSSAAGLAVAGAFLGKNKLQKIVKGIGTSNNRALINQGAPITPKDPLKREIFKKQFKVFMGVGAMTLITFLGWELGGVVYKKAAIKAQEKKTEEIEHKAFIDFVIKHQYEEIKDYGYGSKDDDKNVKQSTISFRDKVLYTKITIMNRLKLASIGEEFKKIEKDVQFLNRFEASQHPMSRFFLEKYFTYDDLKENIKAYFANSFPTSTEDLNTVFLQEYVKKYKHEIFKEENRKKIKKILNITVVNEDYYYATKELKYISLKKILEKYHAKLSKEELLTLISQSERTTPAEKERLKFLVLAKNKFSDYEKTILISNFYKELIQTQKQKVFPNLSESDEKNLEKYFKSAEELMKNLSKKKYNSKNNKKDIFSNPFAALIYSYGKTLNKYEIIEFIEQSSTLDEVQKAMLKNEFLEKLEESGLKISRNKRHPLENISLTRSDEIHKTFYYEILERYKDKIFTQENIADMEERYGFLYTPASYAYLLPKIVEKRDIISGNLYNLLRFFYKDFTQKEMIKLIEESELLDKNEKLALKETYDVENFFSRIVQASKTLTPGEKTEYTQIKEDPLLYQKFLTNTKLNNDERGSFGIAETRNSRVFYSIISLFKGESGAVIYDTLRNNIMTGEFFAFVSGLWIGGYTSSQITQAALKKTGLIGKTGVKAFFKRTAVGFASFALMMTILSSFIFLVPVDTQKDLTLWFKKTKKSFVKNQLDTKELSFLNHYNRWIGSSNLTETRFEKVIQRHLKRMKRDREKFADAFKKNLYLSIQSLLEKYGSISLINQTLKEPDIVNKSFISIFFQIDPEFNSIKQALLTRKNLSCTYFRGDQKQCKDFDSKDDVGFLMFNKLDEQTRKNLRKEREEIKQEILVLNKKLLKNYHQLVDLYGRQTVFFKRIIFNFEKNLNFKGKKDKTGFLHTTRSWLNYLEKKFKYSNKPIEKEKYLATIKKNKFYKLISDEIYSLEKIYNHVAGTYRPFLFFDNRSCLNEMLLTDELIKNKLNKLNKLSYISDDKLDKIDYKVVLDQFQSESSSLRSYMIREYGPIIDYVSSAVRQLFYHSEETQGQKYSEESFVSIMAAGQSVNELTQINVLAKRDYQSKCINDFTSVPDFVERDPKSKKTIINIPKYKTFEYYSPKAESEFREEPF